MDRARYPLGSLSIREAARALRNERRIWAFARVSSHRTLLWQSGRCDKLPQVPESAVSEPPSPRLRQHHRNQPVRSVKLTGDGLPAHHLRPNPHVAVRRHCRLPWDISRRLPAPHRSTPATYPGPPSQTARSAGPAVTRACRSRHVKSARISYPENRRSQKSKTYFSRFLRLLPRTAPLASTAHPVT